MLGVTEVEVPALLLDLAPVHDVTDGAGEPQALDAVLSSLVSPLTPFRVALLGPLASEFLETVPSIGDLIGFTGYFVHQRAEWIPRLSRFSAESWPLLVFGYRVQKLFYATQPSEEETSAGVSPRRRRRSSKKRSDAPFKEIVSPLNWETLKPCLQEYLPEFLREKAYALLAPFPPTEAPLASAPAPIPRALEESAMEEAPLQERTLNLETFAESSLQGEPLNAETFVEPPLQGETLNAETFAESALQEETLNAETFEDSEPSSPTVDAEPAGLAQDGTALWEIAAPVPSPLAHEAPEERAPTLLLSGAPAGTPERSAETSSISAPSRPSPSVPAVIVSPDPTPPRKKGKRAVASAAKPERARKSLGFPPSATVGGLAFAGDVPLPPAEPAGAPLFPALPKALAAAQAPAVRDPAEEAPPRGARSPSAATPKRPVARANSPREPLSPAFLPYAMDPQSPQRWKESSPDRRRDRGWSWTKYFKETNRRRETDPLQK
jgi:hypothetical protein